MQTPIYVPTPQVPAQQPIHIVTPQQDWSGMMQQFGLSMRELFLQQQQPVPTVNIHQATHAPTHDQEKDDGMDVKSMFKDLKQNIKAMDNTSKDGLKKIDDTMKGISKQLEDHTTQLTQHTAQIGDLLEKFEGLCTRVDKIEVDQFEAPGGRNGGGRGQGAPRGGGGRGGGDSQPFQGEAKNPCALRLKGFDCMYTRPDLKIAATEVIQALGFDDKAIVSTIHASGNAYSCVIEFNSEEDADKVFKEARKHGSILWSENETSGKQTLKITHDESREVARMGAALRVLWDNTLEELNTVIPKQKFGLSCARNASLLVLVLGKRRYPIFKLEENIDTFIFAEKNSRCSPPKWITSEMLDRIKKKTLEDELFEK